MGLKTYYAVKWFRRTEVVEEVEVTIDDPRHQQHSNVLRQLVAAGGRNGGEAVSLSGWQLRPGTARVKTGETALSGSMQSHFHAYPEVGVRTRDPKLVNGKTPATCMAGWHVPFLTTLEQFVPNNYGRTADDAEAWLVKVGGAHSNLRGENKVAFTYIELRKQLNTAQVIGLMGRVAKCVTAGDFTKPPIGQPYWSGGRGRRPNTAYMSLLDYVKQLDRRPHPNSYRNSTLKGTGQYVLVAADSLTSAESE